MSEKTDLERAERLMGIVKEQAIALIAEEIAAAYERGKMDGGVVVTSQEYREHIVSLESVIDSFRRDLREMSDEIRGLEIKKPRGHQGFPTVPGCDEKLCEVQQFCDAYEGHTVINIDDATIDTSDIETVESSLRTRLSDLTDIVTRLHDFLPKKTP